MKEPEERESRAWQAVYLCFYDGEIYREAVRNWRGLAFRYLCLLILASWAVLSLRLQVSVSRYFDEFVLPVIEAMPVMSVNKEKIFEIDRDSPLEITDPRNGRLLIRFDLAQRPVMPVARDDGIFVFRDRFYLQYRGRQKEVEFTESWPSSFDPSTWKQPLIYVRNFAAPALFCIFAGASLLAEPLKALILGLLGKILAHLNRRPLSYPQLVRLSVLAITPALLIDTLQRLFAVSLPHWHLLSLLLTLGYLVYGIRSIPVSINRVSGPLP